MSREVASLGRTVGHHVLVRELGRGGMGTVYLARDLRLDREVAIKFISVDSPAATQRFLAEARATARCKHPHIVDIYEIGDDGGQPYMVLEYVDGESAQARLARGPLAAGEAIGIMTQVARGLAFAHSRGIIHRDLKPANILVTAGGVAKLVDFGIAKPLDDEGLRVVAELDDAAADDSRELTATSELPGTVHYISPEQARYEPTDERADLWAFGVTLYQLLSGRRPLDGLVARDVFAHLIDLDRELPRLDAFAPHVPAALVDLAHRCLEKRPELRVMSATELVAALEAVRDEARPEVPTASTPRPRRRRAVAAAIAAIVLLGLLAWAVTSALRRPRAPAAAAAPGGAVVSARVDALLAELDHLDRRGAGAEADRLLAEFLTEESDPDSVALAWLARGDRERRRGGADGDAAMTSYAAAYARAAHPGVQRRALLAVAHLYLERWEWDGLAAALELIDELPGPAGADADADADAGAIRERYRLAVRDGAATGGASGRIGGAVLAGRPTDLRLTNATTVDVDGDGDLDVVALEGDELVARTADTLAELLRRPAAGLGMLGCAGRDHHGAYVVARQPYSGTRYQLVPLDAGPAVALDRVPPMALGHCRCIDVDGRGGDELYLFGDVSLVRVHRDADGEWTHDVIPVGSEVWDAIGGDLDGDGRRELVLSVGQWRGYEVRLLRPDATGTLRVLDRVRLGLVGALADLGRDAAGNARIGAIKLDVYPTVRELPADRPLGAPAGLYVLELAGDRLRVVRHLELPGITGDAWYRLAGRHFPDVWPVQVADLDGDGRRDVVARVVLDTGRPNLLVMLGEDDGGFATRVISGIEPQAVVEHDGDTAAELVVSIDGVDGAWILGGGATPVPRRRVAAVPRVEPAAVAALDPSIAAAWGRAEQLARIGQVEAAADALRRIAASAPEPAVKRAALHRAASLAMTAGTSAAPTFEAVAQLPGVADAERVQAWLAAIEDDLAHIALIDGRARVERLRASGLPLDDDAARRLAAASARLPDAPQAVFGPAGLDPTWRIADPSLVHVVPGSGQLAVETLSPGMIAALPLTAHGDAIVITADFEVTRMEWASSLVFRLGPPDGAAVVEAGIGARGGGLVYRRGFTCAGAPASAGERYAPLPDSDAVVAVHLELAVIPGARRGRCSIVADGRPMTVDVDVDIEPAGLDRWSLAIGAGAFADMTSATARITSVRVGGAAPAAAPPSELDAAVMELVNHQPDNARAHLARLDGAAAATWPAQRAAAIAAVERGDRPAAVRLLAAALRDPAGRPSLTELASLARARDGQFLPALRLALGRQSAPLLAAAWTVTAQHELDEPRVRTALLRDLDGLPPATAATRDATASLLGYLGEALLAAGRPGDARRAFAGAQAMIPTGSGVGRELRDRAERIAQLLAREAATRGDEVAARRWALASLDLGNYPEAAADRILLDPALRLLTAGPGWERVRQLGRSLAAVP